VFWRDIVERFLYLFYLSVFWRDIVERFLYLFYLSVFWRDIVERFLYLFYLCVLEGHSREVPIPVLSAGKPDKNSHQLHTRRYCSSKKYFTI
jgi:hypothetical protein